MSRTPQTTLEKDCKLDQNRADPGKPEVLDIKLYTFLGLLSNKEAVLRGSIWNRSTLPKRYFTIHLSARLRISGEHIRALLIATFNCLEQSAPVTVASFY
jgi:hypothetical protein